LAYFFNVVQRLGVKSAIFNEPVYRKVSFLGPAPNEQSLFSIELEVSDYTQARYYYQFPDPSLRDLILFGGGVFVDIGANVGIFSLLAARSFKQVAAFEPFPKVFDQLEKNCSVFPNIKAFNIALSDERGTSPIYQNAFATGASSLVPFSDSYKRGFQKADWGSAMVRTDLADNVLANFTGGIDLVKVDVEGHEVQVIRGASATIAHHRPILFVETHNEERFREICELLPGGFVVFDPVKRTFCRERAHPDSLFVWPNRLHVIERVFGVRCEVDVGSRFFVTL